MAGKIEVIARGLLVSDRRVLVCRTKGAAETYLPGGHVAFGESARAALKRELKEETGADVKIGCFLGAVEHTFVQKGRRHWEINLVFRIGSDSLTAKRPVVPRESWMEFHWVPLGQAARFRLEPRALCRMLERWARNIGTGAFLSTLGEP